MRIVIEKNKRQLTVYIDNQVTLILPIGLGREPIGAKLLEGDGKTPEGQYYVCTKNAQSKYHRSLGLSYPSAWDAGCALESGIIDATTHSTICEAIAQNKRPPWDTALGGFIMIHGGGIEMTTQGCIALSDADSQWLFDVCPMGAAVEIVP